VAVVELVSITPTTDAGGVLTPHNADVADVAPANSAGADAARTGWRGDYFSD
jgi:hypothetical protein